MEKVDSCRDGRELLSITKQSAGEKRDVIVVKAKVTMVKVGLNDRTQTWNEHMERLMNVKNRLGDSITASKVIGAVRRIDIW